MASLTHPLKIPVTTLDVFTSSPYTGNPLAIIHLPSSSTLSQTQKQAIAKEFNLSETVFLHPQTNASRDEAGAGVQAQVPEYQIDIFTTTQELPFAGHPTIGTASYILQLSNQTTKRALLKTKAGLIPISLTPDSKVLASVPFNTHLHTSTLSSQNQNGFSDITEIRKAELKAPIFSIVKGMSFLLIQLPSLELLSKVQLTGQNPDFMAVLDEGWKEKFVGRYYYVLQPSISEQEDGLVKIRTRMLDPQMEDPATGSAASALGAYLAGKWGRSTRFEIEQGVEMGRRSVIGVEVDLSDGGEVGGVRLSGEAVIIMDGVVRV